jgi:F-type H+-transporting ATPase subunit b
MDFAMAQNAKQIESIEHVPASEHGRGFPPFDPHTFASQLIWLALSFIALYLLMSRIALPRIGSILEKRRQHIDADLAEAQKIKDDSDAAIAAHEKALAEARARAQTLASATREKAAAAAATRRKAVDAELHARVGEAEEAIAMTRSTAMTNVRNIASEAASAIVARLTGIATTSQEVADAVGRALER